MHSKLKRLDVYIKILLTSVLISGTLCQLDIWVTFTQSGIFKWVAGSILLSFFLIHIFLLRTYKKILKHKASQQYITAGYTESPIAGLYTGSINAFLGLLFILWVSPTVLVFALLEGVVWLIYEFKCVKRYRNRIEEYERQQLREKRTM